MWDGKGEGLGRPRIDETHFDQEQEKRREEGAGR